LDTPEKFALWCENKGELNKKNKTVYLATTYERVVPLTHYSFITCTQGIFKILKDKQLEMEIMKTTNSLHTIQDHKGTFNETNYQKIKKILGIFEDKNHYVKRQHVLNTVSRHLVDHKMLPAICFVLSRKTLELCAKEVTTVLLEDDSKVPYVVHRECEQIIRKLPNYKEYLQLPEYINLLSLLQKGIAIHHAGMMPILREMVELLFAKGYIKLLFATETFAVGINMPTKTVLFTDITKFDGNTIRPLYSHEYTQMSGRAGRRGIDTIGHVIHLTNLFKNNDKTTLQTMMKGKPQTLTSKFKISYNLLLNLIHIGETNYSKYAKRSMVQNDIDNEMKAIYDEISKLQNELETMDVTLKYCNTPFLIVEEYIDLKKKRILCVNKKRKEIERELTKISNTYPNIEKDVDIVTKYNNKQNELNKLNDEMNSTESILETDINKIVTILTNKTFIINTDQVNTLTLKGQIATHLREVHCLIFSEWIFCKKFNVFNAKELVGILSCFTNITVPEEKKYVTPYSQNTQVQSSITELFTLYKQYLDLEIENKLNTGFDYSMHFDLIDYCIQWCECDNDVDCKRLLQNISLEKEIFLGEFIKAILKINNITNEMEKVAEYMGDMDFLSILKQVPLLTLKYVATNQSLYI
jgi:superfamily II RNA helicase